MERAKQAILVLFVALLSGCRQKAQTAKAGPNSDLAQHSPVIASISGLSLQPLMFDGRLVQVRASVALGWEGDNFLFDPSTPMNTNMGPTPHASVWLYCKPGQERQVCGAIRRSNGRVLGTFIGYFHFVPDQKSRMKDVFDPGPLQLEAIGIFD